MSNKKSKNENLSFMYASPQSEEVRIQNLRQRLASMSKEQGARDGVKNHPQHDCLEPFITDWENQIYAEIQQSLTKADATHLQMYNQEESRIFLVEDISGEYSKKDAASSIEALENKRQLLQEEEVSLELDMRHRKAQMEGLSAKIGSTPFKKIWFSKSVYTLLAILIASLEMPLNNAALSSTSDSMNRIECFIFALGVSLIVGILSHFTGKGLARTFAKAKEQSQMTQNEPVKKQKISFTESSIEVFLPLTGIVCIVAMVFGLRWESEERYLLLANIALITGAIILSYDHTGTTPYKEEYDGQERAYKHAKTKLQKVRKKLLTLQNKLVKLQLVDQKENDKRQESLMRDDLENIIVSQQAYHKEYKTLYQHLISVYRDANTGARLDNGVSLVSFWNKSEDTYLPELVFNPIIINNQK